MGELKFRLTGIVLVLITISLAFGVDFQDTVNYAFDKFDIDINSMAEESMKKVLSKSIEEVFSDSFYTYTEPELIENKISDEKYEKLNSLLEINKTYNGILVRGYEEEGYVIARYYVAGEEENYSDTVASELKEKFINAGYTEDKGLLKKDGIEINIYSKWDCVIVIVKGL